MIAADLMLATEGEKKLPAKDVVREGDKQSQVHSFD